MTLNQAKERRIFLWYSLSLPEIIFDFQFGILENLFPNMSHFVDRSNFFHFHAMKRTGKIKSMFLSFAENFSFSNANEDFEAV